MRLISFVIYAALMASEVLIAQPKSIVDKTIFIDYGDRFYADAYVVPTTSPDTAQVFVMFRMANDFLSFTQVTDRFDIGGNFKADMAVSAEVRDTLSVIRQRLRWAGVAYTNTFEETHNKNLFHYGWFSFNVGSGTYDITLEILAQRESNQKRITIRGVSFTPKRPLRQLTPPLFVEPEFREDVELLKPYIFTGNVPFGSTDARALILLSDSVPVDYDFTIKQIAWEGRDIRWWLVSDIIGTTTSSKTRFPRLSSLATTEAPYLEIHEEADSKLPVALVEIPVPLTALVPGKYEIILVRSGTTDTIRIPFRIVWELMPLSLRNIDYAINSMKFIVTEDILDSLDEGSDADRRERLMGWWRMQDPTETTTYNERMAEYFKRLDQAFFAFSTIQEPDGAQSERGKVYVLYGPPTEISKNLKAEGESLEIWRYSNKVGKKFTFIIDDRGIYRLKAVEPMQN
jgi:GWxTD domain-containing protein